MTSRVPRLLRRPGIGSRLARDLAIGLAALAVAACTPQPSSPSPSVGPTLAAPSVPARTVAPTSTPSPAPTPSLTPSPVAEAPAPCPGTDRTPNAPAGRQVIGGSSNWAGYVAAVRKTGVTCVEASWVEPSVRCPARGHQAVAIWIGVDGFSSSLLGIPRTDALVQIGTQADCENGVVTHSAWHEVLPAEDHEIHIDDAVIHPGDHISARISYGPPFTLVLFDRESAFSFSLGQAAPGAPRRTTDWIVEAPATDCPGTCTPVALPTFTPVTFTDAHATIAGQRAAINNDNWTNAKLKMIRKGITRASISNLSSGGTAFTVRFVHT